MKASNMSFFMPTSLISSFFFCFLCFSPFFILISDFLFRRFPLYRVFIVPDVSYSGRGFSLSE